MGMLEDVLATIAPEWDTDGYGLDSMLIAPDGCMIEQDATCPHGYESPLRAAGLV